MIVERPATPDDACIIAATMRACDRAELEAICDVPVYLQLRNSIVWSASQAVEIKGVPVALYGLGGNALHGYAATPWFVAADAINDHWLAFGVAAAKVVDAWRQRHALLYNYVHAENAPARKFLRWLGFCIGAPEPYGMRGSLFCRFEWRKNDVR